MSPITTADGHAMGYPGKEKYKVIMIGENDETRSWKVEAWTPGDAEVQCTSKWRKEFPQVPIVSVDIIKLRR